MRHPRTSGFTLVELMVVIAIVAILVAIGFPSFQGSLRTNRVATATNEVLASVALARTEAIRSTKTATLCASSNGTACGTDWNQGWMVWVDSDGDATLDTGETVRYTQAHPRLLVAVTSTGSLSTNTIVFDTRGRPDPGGTRTFTLKPDDCPAGQQLKRTMTLSGIGQVSTIRGTCP